MSKNRMRRVGWFEDNALNLRLPLCYHPGSGEFSLVFAGTVYCARDQKVLEEQVRAAISDSMHLTWIPTIEVRSVISSLAHAPQFGFSANRIYVCQLPHGLGFKQVGWAVWEHEQLTASTQLRWESERDGPFTPPCVMRGPGVPRLFLPYSDALWTRLETIQQQVGELQRRFFARLATREGIERLIAPDVSLAQVLEMCEVLR